MYEIPTTVTVNDTLYHITNKGDYRMVLDCFSALQDTEMNDQYRVVTSLIIFYEELNSLEDVNALGDTVKPLIEEMFKFFNCGQEQSPGAVVNSGNVIDWDADSQIICAAINNVAKCEIRAVEYLHWWTFLGYYLSVGESVLSTVVSIRDKSRRGKKLEKWEQEFKKNNPQYFISKISKEDQEAEDYIRNLWDNGGGLDGR